MNISVTKTMIFEAMCEMFPNVPHSLLEMQAEQFWNYLEQKNDEYLESVLHEPFGSAD